MRLFFVNKRHGKSILFLAFVMVLFYSKTISAQEKSFFSFDNRTYFETDFRYGKYFPFEARHAYMKSLPQYGVDMRIGRQTDGRMKWERDFNYLS